MKIMAADRKIIMMSAQSRRICAALILAIIAAGILAACGGNASKIVGTWKRTDKTEAATETFTADGDYIAKTPTDLIAGKYELKNDELRVFYPGATKNRDTNLRIVRLEDDVLIVESDYDGKKIRATFEKVGGDAAKTTPKPATAKPAVKEVPLTAPWASMNLPCQNREQEVVALSTESRFVCAYGDRKSFERQTETVTAYAELLRQAGWKATREPTEFAVVYDFEKDGKAIFLTLTGASLFDHDEMQQWEGFGVQMNLSDKK